METIQGSEPRMPSDKPYPVTVLGHPAEMIGPTETYARVSQQIAEVPLEHPHPRFWFTGFVMASALLLMFGVAVGYLLYYGPGIWGINIPVAWGFAITNFVWWIGIGHAGTFISAILLLLMQKWRTTINRFTEAMTLFAVTCAGLFPLLHLGRPWVFYFILPYPDTMSIWPQFRSPLVWDLFAVSTYFTVSLLFWYLGVVPDLATVRDKALTKWRRIIYGIGALGQIECSLRQTTLAQMLSVEDGPGDTRCDSLGSGAVRPSPSGADTTSAGLNPRLRTRRAS